MRVEFDQRPISVRLQPLYEARTATESIKKAIQLLGNTHGQEQEEIIKDPDFGTIVRSALENSDEHRQKREKKLFETIEKDNFSFLDEALHSSF